MTDLYNEFQNIRSLIGIADPGKADGQSLILLKLAKCFDLYAPKFSSEQAAILSDLIISVAVNCDEEALVSLSRELAITPKIPKSLLYFLAEKNSHVAFPILEYNPGFTAQDLLNIARNKGERHQLAIARRAKLPSKVIEYLIICNDPLVVETLRINRTLQIDPSLISVSDI